MIWANTERVGCATTICHSNSPFGSQFGSSWTFTVCRYSPQGNYIGEHPLKAIGGEGKCGSCARSAKQESDLWAAEGDDFQVCVPPSGDEILSINVINSSNAHEPKAVCCFDLRAGFEQQTDNWRVAFLARNMKWLVTVLNQIK